MNVRLRVLPALLLGLVLALVPVAAYAAEGDDGDDLLLRINGDAVVRSGDRVGTVVVVNGDARIDGTVKKAVVVVQGTAFVAGTVEGEITVINGTLELAGTARVKNISLVRSNLVRASGAVVTGGIHERERFVFRGAAGVFSFLLWLGMTVAVLGAGLLFAAVGGRQLAGVANSLTAETGKTVLAGILLWLALPVLAVVFFITLVGIPLAIGLLLVVAPALWFLGYISVGTRLGAVVFRLVRADAESVHPYAAVASGMLVLQLVVLVPLIGALTMVLAGLWGAGALAFAAFRAARGHGVSAHPGPPIQTAPGEPAG